MKPPGAAEPADVRAIYTERAADYHRFVRSCGYPQGVRALLKSSGWLRSDMRVLDAGCGSGIVTLALREALEARGLGPGVTHGFDLTPAMLERFRATLERRGLTGIELRQANVLELEALPDSWRDYDLVLSSSMLEYVPRGELPRALRGLRERLAPDGRFLLLISRRNPLMKWLIERWWDANLYGRAELGEALAAAGFTAVRFRRFPLAWRHLAVWGHVVEARAS